MRVIAVDDEKLGLESLVSAINKANSSIEVHAFNSPTEALEYVKENGVDVAFLDIQMRGMTGITLAKAIKIENPKVNIVFVTGYGEYKVEAFDMRASGYIAKPVSSEDISDELANLRNPIEPAQVIEAADQASGERSVNVQTFGNFEVFVEHQPVKFKYEKTKEMFAYLIDRNGAYCSFNEIASNLWEDDDNHNSYLRGLKKDMLDSFAALGVKELFFQKRGSLAIDTTKVQCDYYEFLSGHVKALNAYRGEYMSQYSWSEITNASLEMGRV